MFVGHYALGYYIKGRYSDVPLWLILLGVQGVDLRWALLVALGIERASFNPEASVFMRAVYEYYPYTHSLFMGVVIALLAFLIVRRLSNVKWALVTGVAIISHWFLDLLVHGPDVPLFFNNYKMGFGLWNFPVLTLVLEVLLFTAGMWYLIARMSDRRIQKWSIGIYLFLVLFYVGSFFAPPVPPTTLQLGIFGVLIYGGVPVLAYFAERKRTHVL